MKYNKIKSKSIKSEMYHLKDISNTNTFKVYTSCYPIYINFVLILEVDGLIQHCTQWFYSIQSKARKTFPFKISMIISVIEY